MSKKLKTHEVLDLHYTEGMGCFVGTAEECNEFVAKQGMTYFMYKVVPMTKEEIENYPDNEWWFKQKNNRTVV